MVGHELTSDERAWRELGDTWEQQVQTIERGDVIEAQQGVDVSKKIDPKLRAVSAMAVGMQHKVHPSQRQDLLNTIAYAAARRMAIHAQNAHPNHEPQVAYLGMADPRHWFGNFSGIARSER